METLQRAAWIVLALVHAPPALVALRPTMMARLYGLDPVGDASLLLVHRGVLFLAIVALALVAAFDAGARRAAVIAVGVSVIGYLVLYARQGMPPGPLRTVALADLFAVLPLAVAAYGAWIRPPA